MLNIVNTKRANLTDAYLQRPRWNNKRSPVPIIALNIPGLEIGAATAAYQIEGRHGRGESHWDKYFIERPSYEESGEIVNGDIAVEHFVHMEADVALMSKIGLQVYRFSISWPRIMPHADGEVSAEGLAFYDRLINLLLKYGIRPNLTCFHWDLPQWAADKGGWLNRETAEAFARYCTVLARHFGDRVKMWGTVNEPEVIVAGYIGTGLAPAANDYRLRVIAAHHVMVAHALGLQALRAVGGNTFKIGLALNLVPQEVFDTGNSRAVAAASKRWKQHYAIYLDAILTGKYPEVVLEEAAETGVDIKPGDMELINQPIDWLGVNWYLRHVVDEDGNVIPNEPGWEITLMNWEVHSPALTRMLVAMKGEYENLPPIVITENGAALQDSLENGRVRDVGRMQYLHDHLLALEDASNAGVKIAGYYVWSFIDNLEWSLGFKMTFGIVHVVRSTMRRVLKDSALWYRATIKATKKKSASAKKR
jgi:beta-glucosidase